MKTPILGAAYQAASINAAADRCINLYYEAIPHGGREPGYLYKMPGLRRVLTLGNGPVRGMHLLGNVGYIVSGSTLYTVDSVLSATAIGPVSVSNLPVSMDDNGSQLFIACGSEAFIYTPATGTLAEITDADFPGASSVAYIDGYFCFTEPTTQRFWWTALYDGFDVDALDFASAEGNPDNVVAMRSLHREAWLFGRDTIEVFYNSGATDQPFQRMQGAFIETGCVASASVAQLDNTLYWLGKNQEGQGIVYRAEGYNARRVSTHAIELAIEQSASPGQATAFAYQQRGHSFYVLNLPESTWVYDASTNLWHQRATLQTGELKRWRANGMMQLGQDILVGDYESGNIYVLDPECHTDNDAPLPWIRAWRALPPGRDNGALLRHSSLTVHFEPGVGSSLEPNPVMQLRWSDDGGHTWGNYHECAVGKIGEYKRRAVWRRLGVARDRVYELSGADPVKVAIIGAELA